MWHSIEWKRDRFDLPNRWIAETNQHVIHLAIYHDISIWEIYRKTGKLVSRGWEPTEKLAKEKAQEYVKTLESAKYAKQKT